MSGNDEALPLGEAFDAAELERRFRALEVRPPANPDHAFEIRVPRDWTAKVLPEMNRPVGYDVLTPLAGWQAPGSDDDAPPLFHVQAVKLPREISAKNLLIQSALALGMDGHFMREVSVRLADALAQSSVEGANVLERMVISIDGDRAFVLMGIATADRYLEVQEVFGAMVASFQVLTRSSKPSIERWQRYSLLGEAVGFEHPESWRPALLDGSDDQRAVVSLFGFDPDDVIGGIMHVEAVRGRPLAVADEYERVLGACRLSNIVPNGDPTDVPLEVSGERFRALGMRTYPSMIEGNDLDQEIWIVLLEARDLVVRVWMTTPAKGADFAHWATNRRAFEILMGTLR
jgi:hypothetical protein